MLGSVSVEQGLLVKWCFRAVDTGTWRNSLIAAYDARNRDVDPGSWGVV